MKIALFSSPSASTVTHSVAPHLRVSHSGTFASGTPGQYQVKTTGPNEKLLARAKITGKHVMHTEFQLWVISCFFCSLGKLPFYITANHKLSDVICRPNSHLSDVAWRRHSHLSDVAWRLHSHLSDVAWRLHSHLSDVGLR